MVVNEHTKLVNAEAVQMCRDFLVTPGKHMEHPKRFSNSIVMSLREYPVYLLHLSINRSILIM
jgi:hypothetical protein